MTGREQAPGTYRAGVIYEPKQMRPECWHTDADLRPPPSQVGWMTRRARRTNRSRP